MQTLDCRNLKDLLDSYLSDELLVETNHAVLRHLEQCPSCRAEMTARRSLRESLRRAGTQMQMSAESKARLRERLRAEATFQLADEITSTKLTEPRQSGFKHLINSFTAWLTAKPFPLSVAAAVVLLLTLSAGWFLFQPAFVAAAELSRALIQEATHKHESCSAHFRDEATPLIEEDLMKQYDPAYAGLDRLAEVNAQGLRLRAAHICGFAGRSFAHLVYTRGDELVSLLVTERNAKAMKTGVVPNDDGLKAGFQQEVADTYKVSALQTRHHVVLLITSFSAQENQTLAEKIAAPISHHLRVIEAQLPSADSSRTK